MIRNFFLLLLDGICFLASAQSIEPNIVNCSGGSIVGEEMTIEWSLGELSITTLGADNYLVTEGFIQPNLGNIVRTKEKTLYCNILAYPNPVNAFLYISSKSFDKWNVEVYDISGKLLIKNGYHEKVDLRTLIPGLYLILLYTPEGLPVNSFKIIKV